MERHDGESFVSVDIGKFELCMRGSRLELSSAGLGSAATCVAGRTGLRICEGKSYYFRIRVSTTLGRQFVSQMMVNRLNSLTSVEFESFKVRWKETLDSTKMLEGRKVIVDIYAAKKPGRRLVDTLRNVLPLSWHKLGRVSLDLSTLCCCSAHHNFLVARDERESSDLRVSFEAQFSEKKRITLSIEDLEVGLEESFCDRFDGRFNLTCSLESAEHQTGDGATTAGEQLKLHLDQDNRAARGQFLGTLDNLIEGVLRFDVRNQGSDVAATGNLESVSWLEACVGRGLRCSLELNTASAGTESCAEPCAKVGFTIKITGVPSTSQLRGGVHSESGIKGGRPVLTGIRLPMGIAPGCNNYDSLDGSFTRLQAPWVQFVDSLGFVSYFNYVSREWSWLSPNAAQHTTTESFRPGDLLNRSLGAATRRQSLFNGLRSSSAGQTLGVVPQRAEGQEAAAEPPVELPASTESASYSNMLMQTDHALPAMAQEASRDGLRAAVAEQEFALDRSMPNIGPVLPRDECVTDRGAGEQPAAASREVAASATEESLLDTAVPEIDVHASEDWRWTKLRFRSDNCSFATKIMCGPASEGHTMLPIWYGSTLLKFGGRGRDGWSGQLHAFDAESYNWTLVPSRGSRPSRRTGHGGSVLYDGTRMLIFGGATGSGRLNDLYILNTEPSVWEWTSVKPSTNVVPAPRARVGMDALSNGTQAILFGGREGFRFLGDRYYNDIHVFDASRMEWIEVKNRGFTNPPPRSGHSAHIVNDRQLMIFGGLEDSKQYYNDTWLFDLPSETWVRPPYASVSKPCAREDQASCRFNNNVVIYGGQSDKGTFLNDVHIFDSTSLQWRSPINTGGASPGCRAGSSMAVVNDTSLLLFGGDMGFSYKNDSHILEVATSRLVGTRLDSNSRIVMSGEDRMCVVCFEEPVQVVFQWCGHCCCCLKCSARLVNCPLCRKFIGRVDPLPKDFLTSPESFSGVITAP